MAWNATTAAKIVKLVPRDRPIPPGVWREPTLDEILADPIIKDLMAADGVNAAMVRLTMSRAASRRKRIPI